MDAFLLRETLEGSLCLQILGIFFSRVWYSTHKYMHQVTNARTCRWQGHILEPWLCACSSESP